MSTDNAEVPTPLERIELKLDILRVELARILDTLEMLKLSTAISFEPTRWMLHCPNHGKVYLTEVEFDRQVGSKDEDWICPVCREPSEFDMENYKELKPR